MRETLRKHQDSIKTALEGLVWSLKTQPNFKIHIVLSVLVLTLGWYLKITHVEMTILVFAIILGLSGEMINTAFESVVDLVTSEWRKEAKIAKDVAAGMMLVVSIGAIIIALLILGPYVLG